MNKQERDNINQLFNTGGETNQDLAVMLMMGLSNCTYKIFGTIGSYLTEDMEIKHFVETFTLIETVKDIKALNFIKLRHNANPQIKYKCFVFDIKEKMIFEHMEEEKREDCYEFANYIELLKPNFFKL